MVETKKPTGDSHPLDVARRKLADAALQLLADMQFADLTHGKIAAHANINTATAQQVFASPMDMIDAALANLDAEIAVRLAEDLAEAGEAGLRDKILEGLIQRFEAMTPHKTALRHLESASRRNPLLASMLLRRFHAGMRVLLAITGGSATRPKNIRDAVADTGMIAGLGVICMLAWRVWLKDETPDLAETSRVLDTRLRQAEEWAFCFGSGGGDGDTTETKQTE